MSKLKKAMNRSGISRALIGLRQIGKPNLVFIWIPKNAGTSVYKCLAEAGCLKAKTTWDVKTRFPQKGIVTFGHMSYSDLVANGYVTSQYDQSAMKFCVVRNPFSRAVSLFVYLQKRGLVPAGHSFLEFCRALKEIDEVGLYHTRNLSMAQPQSRWLDGLHSDRLRVIRYEAIQQEFAALLSELPIQVPELKWENRSRRGGVEGFYCPESFDLVTRFYACDFKGFGYSDSDIVNA